MRLMIKSLLLTFLLPLAVSAADLEARFVDEKGKPVVDAVISAYPLASQTLPAPSSAVLELEQINKEFKPHVTVVQLGGKVSFPNRDGVAHHVYSFSEAKKFELPLYTGLPEPMVFDRAGVVTLGCNIHDWMKGYILVVDTPFFALSNAEGRARLAGLPEGPWRLEVWHPRLKGDLINREVQLTDKAGPEESFSLSLRREWKKRRGTTGEGPGY